jgi:hypothetical protein
VAIACPTPTELSADPTGQRPCADLTEGASRR